ncbi:substrate-binding domain-containing protein [Mediterraneibacter gnavus]
MQESIEGKKVLTFGVTMTIGEYAIVPALSRFIKTHPDMDFHIDMATRRPFSPIFTKERSILQLWKDILAVIITRHVSTKAEKYIAVASAHHTFSKPVHNSET